MQRVLNAATRRGSRLNAVLNTLWAASWVSGVLLGTAGCGRGDPNGNVALFGDLASDSQPLIRDQDAKALRPKPSGAANALSSESSARLGPSCSGDATGRLCLALKYLVYRDSDGKSVVTVPQILENLAEINSVWAQCGISFEIEAFAAEDPRSKGLRFNASSTSELDEVRMGFAEASSLLVVTTGTWAGSLGAGAANAWSTMPGGSWAGSVFEGVVLEQPVGAIGNLVAHELGHMLSLDHVSDPRGVMSPMVSPDSLALTQDQCQGARATASQYWQSALR